MAFRQIALVCLLGMMVVLLQAGSVGAQPKLITIHTYDLGIITHVTPQINGPVVATAGLVTLEFTNGHYAATIAMAWVEGDPCSTLGELPQVTGCTVYSSVPLYGTSAPIGPTLDNAKIGIAIGDGPDLYSFPAVTFVSDPCWLPCP